jgi:methylphosphotriester-DNA--protein-cysteine methyltransferase
VLIKESPFQYLTAWRMQKASRRLLDGDPIAEVARAVGYEGYGAFVKAFKKHLGGDARGVPAAGRGGAPRRRADRRVGEKPA